VSVIPARSRRCYDLGDEIIFKVKFKPKLSWADKTYLGNLLVEALGAISSQTSAFDFEVEETPS
jgi:hypothetical protein